MRKKEEKRREEKRREEKRRERRERKRERIETVLGLFFHLLNCFLFKGRRMRKGKSWFRN